MQGFHGPERPARGRGFGPEIPAVGNLAAAHLRAWAAERGDELCESLGERG
jgi:hypothetical protein